MPNIEKSDDKQSEDTDVNTLANLNLEWTGDDFEERLSEVYSTRSYIQIIEP